MPRPAALVFDLDGTLIDSRRDITTAINRMRGELGLPPLPLEAVITMVGEGARLLVERALGPDFRPAGSTSAPSPATSSTTGRSASTRPAPIPASRRCSPSSAGAIRWRC